MNTSGILTTFNCPWQRYGQGSVEILCPHVFAGDEAHGCCLYLARWGPAPRHEECNTIAARSICHFGAKSVRAAQILGVNSDPRRLLIHKFDMQDTVCTDAGQWRIVREGAISAVNRRINSRSQRDFMVCVSQLKKRAACSGQGRGGGDRGEVLGVMVVPTPTVQGILR